MQSFNKSTLFHATNSSDEEADDFYDLSIDITSNQTFTKNELSVSKSIELTCLRWKLNINYLWIEN